MKHLILCILSGMVLIWLQASQAQAQDAKALTLQAANAFGELRVETRQLEAAKIVESSIMELYKAYASLEQAKLKLESELAECKKNESEESDK